MLGACRRHRVPFFMKQGTTDGVIAGVDWVTANAQLPAVANMSLGGKASNALDAAVRASIASGVTYAIAAGNDNRDACRYSPARVTEALTVGATDQSDRRASFSNYGACLDLFAPGVGILSASSWGGDEEVNYSITPSSDGTEEMSGTSMAAPHVAGVAALYLQAYPTASPQGVGSALLAAATPGAVQNASSANASLLYSLGWPGEPAGTAPEAEFTSGCAGLACTLTAASANATEAWWSFGDAYNVYEPAAPGTTTHTYALASPSRALRLR